MSFDAETLYRLLPAIDRIRDLDQGEPLKALLTVIAEQVAVLEADLDQLYDDQFIETCAEWVIPYIGDLIGDRPLHGITAQTRSPRAQVANTIGYRRRKGTASMLEQLVRDVTGWNARVVEFFQLLRTTQYLNHLRLTNLASPDLKRWQPLEYLNTPFENTTHNLDVRRIASQRGRYNIPNIGIFLWRLQAYGITQGTARLDAGGTGYRFNPLQSIDAPLFNSPQTETEFTHLAEPFNVPAPLSRRVLYEELEAYRQALVDGEDFSPVYFGSSPVFEIFLDRQPDPIPPEEIVICDLSDWRQPPASKEYYPQHDPSQPVQTLSIRVAVDPVLGRLVFAPGVTAEQVEVSYSYGFSDDMGGGSYDRGNSVFPLLTRPVTWQRGVLQAASVSESELVTTLSAAIADWNSQPEGTVGIIAIMDSRTYAEALPTIRIPAESQLLIVAADWAKVPIPDAAEQRLLGQVSPEGVRPHLLSNLTVEGTADTEAPSPGELILNGLLVEGTLTILPGNLGSLKAAHCTLAPTAAPNSGEIRVDAENSSLRLQINCSICGKIALPDSVPVLNISSSIVDGQEKTAIAAVGTDTEIETSTILGSSTVRSIEASNSIFIGQAIAIRRQVGCVRFSSLAAESQVPRRYQCQPDLALTKRAKELGILVSNLSNAEQAAVRLRVTPQFTSRRYGNPAYGQLSQRCAIEIRQGADDEAEMGAFHDLFQPQRETNLRVRLDEYLRFGLEAGVFYIT